MKTHFVPQVEESDLSQSVAMEASTRRERFERKKLHPQRYSFCNNPLQTSGDPVIIWSFAKFDCLYDDFGVKTHFVPQIEESDPAQIVPLEASTRKECFERKKLHPRRDSFCNNALQTSRDRLIIWSFGNLIACRMTLE